MTNVERAKLFFPGARKEVRVQGITLLQSSEGEKRIKLDLLMPLDDGKQVGMPGWIGDAYDHIAKAETVEKYTKFDVELEAMSLYCHSTEDADKPMQTLFNGLLNSFSISRGKQDDDDEDLGGIGLKFTARIPSNPKLWSWLYPYHRNSIFVRFETTQADLELEHKPAEDKQLTLEQSAKNVQKHFGSKAGDEYDEERREANSKAHDAEFAGSRRRSAIAQ